MLGLAVPRGCFAAVIERQLLPLINIVLVPAFLCVFRTQHNAGINRHPIPLLRSLGRYRRAVIGKVGACYLGARFSGQSHDDFLSLGIL